MRMLFKRYRFTWLLMAVVIAIPGMVLLFESCGGLPLLFDGPELEARIAVVAGIGIILAVFLFFLRWRLTLIVLAPVAFALVGTLGTLKLLGPPVGLPGILLLPVIMGVGIGYGICYTCSYQRYPDERHPFMRLIRQAIFLVGTTTLIGFGVLALARHPVLKGIGLTLLLGIGYSLAGAFWIVPPLVKRVLVPVALPPEALEAGSARHTRRALLRYRHIETTPRLFARWKIRLDPMFPRLAGLVKNPRRILDIGSGYGVPSVWLLELFPAARVTCVDPDEERIHVAGRALGTRGEARVGYAPELGGLPGGADTAMILDVIHMLDDGALRRTLEILQAKLIPGGRLILRATIPAGGPRTWLGVVEAFRLRHQGLTAHYRSREILSAMIGEAGFAMQTIEVSGNEEVWFVAEKPGGAPEQEGVGGASPAAAGEQGLPGLPARDDEASLRKEARP